MSERVDTRPRAFHQQNTTLRWTGNKRQEVRSVLLLVVTTALGKLHISLTMCLPKSYRWLYLGLVFPVSLSWPQCYRPYFHDLSFFFFFLIFHPMNTFHLLNPFLGSSLFHAQSEHASVNSPCFSLLFYNIIQVIWNRWFLVFSSGQRRVAQQVLDGSVNKCRQSYTFPCKLPVPSALGSFTHS